MPKLSQEVKTVPTLQAPQSVPVFETRDSDTKPEVPAGETLNNANGLGASFENGAPASAANDALQSLEVPDVENEDTDRINIAPPLMQVEDPGNGFTTEEPRAETK